MYLRPPPPAPNQVCVSRAPVCDKLHVNFPKLHKLGDRWEA